MFRRRDDSHEFRPLLAEIETEPVNPLGRTVFWVILTAMVFFGGWTCFGMVDVVVSARGKVIPVGEIKILQPLTTGVVSRILVQEGERVTKGQVLMEIDPSGTEPQLDSMREDANHIELELLRLRAALDDTPFHPLPERYGADRVALQRRLYASARERLRQQVQAKKEEMREIEERQAKAEAERDRLQSLLRIAEEKIARLAPVRDIVSRQMYDGAVAEVENYRYGLTGETHRCEELRSVGRRLQRELEVIVANEHDKILSEIVDRRNKLNYLRADIEKTSYLNGRQQLIAPVAGFVNKLFIHTVGGVVSPAEKLIALVPSDTPLLVRALVRNKDIGFVSRGMDATIKIDTYDFQKYGVLAGRVRRVARDSIEDKGLGLVYEVAVAPLQTELPVGGASTSIATGMSVTTEIKVGRRRIIEFFIYPLIKYLDEGITVR
ncbi:MAG: HlyD family type I secretion periplasmic adaptor subunit [Thermodesulfobacteriota bacterium]